MFFIVGSRYVDEFLAQAEQSVPSAEQAREVAKHMIAVGFEIVYVSDPTSRDEYVWADGKWRSHRKPVEQVESYGQYL